MDTFNVFKKSLRHAFIPGRHNDHHPSSLGHVALTAYLILGMVSFVVLKNIGAQTGNVLGFATDISSDRLFALTNEKRVNNGLPELAYNSQLAAAAAGKAQDMLAKGYWAHFGPNGESPWTFILGSGYSYDTAGENLAKNFTTSGEVVDAWMDSPTHRENLLKSSYRDVGYAVANGNLGGEDTTLVVQLFGSKSVFAPAAPAEVPSPTQTAQRQVNSAESEMVRVAAIVPKATDTHKPVIVPPTLSPTPNGYLGAVVIQAAYPQPKPFSLDLYPAFKTIVALLVAFLVSAFVIDLYHLSETEHLAHRGKHIAHVIFLVSILFAMFFLGRGSIL